MINDDKVTEALGLRIREASNQIILLLPNFSYAVEGP